MLTDDKIITTPEYWRQIYEGERNNAKTDSSNFKRPANAFDRFQWLADQVEGPYVLDVGSGHAVTMKRLKAMHHDWEIHCSDQTEAAKVAANWKGPYHICSAYKLPFADNFFTTVTASQCLEYFEHPDLFIHEAMRVADYFVCTHPILEMKNWSQLRSWSEKDMQDWIGQYADILHFDKVPGLMLVKAKFKK